MIVPFRADCRLTLTAPVPPGLVGLNVELQAFGFVVTGDVAATEVVTIAFQ